MVGNPTGQPGFKRDNLAGQGIEPVRPVLSRAYHKIRILRYFLSWGVSVLRFICQQPSDRYLDPFGGLLDSLYLISNISKPDHFDVMKNVSTIE